MEYSQADLEDSLPKELSCIVCLHQIAHGEDVKLFSLAPIRQVKAVFFEIFNFFTLRFLGLGSSFGDISVLRDN